MVSQSFFSLPRVYTRKLARRLLGHITLSPATKTGKRALLSYVTHPFCIPKQELDRSPHTNPWECLTIAELLLERGYTVDVIEWTNTAFLPKKKYDVVIDVHNNLERLAPLLGRECIKIFYATGAHWAYQNQAERARIEALTKRRRVTIQPRRQLAPENPMQYADHATALGSSFSADTYPDRKPETLIPLLSIVEFPSPARKDFSVVNKNFVFIGGGGAIHKGLDLVLEAFAELPDYHLTICGPMTAEKDFAQAYEKELSLPNITSVGRIDVRGASFKEIIDRNVGLIYPTCSEGQAGSVITGLHAGLVPIVTRQSGVDVAPFGIELTEATVETITREVTKVSRMTPEELQKRSVAAWEYARTHHTHQAFRTAYASFLDRVLR